ncbi:MAG: FAD binding domain-containing protein [Candidatus Dormibacterales bacterium]
MKPAPFDYVRAGSVEEALAALAAPEAKIVAGGQSLVPLLNLRLARPARLVDVNRVPGLDALEAVGGELRVGTLVRHSRLMSEPLVRERAPLLAEAAGLVGHVAVRNRGTFGGSLAHADPTAELPAAALALEARLLLRSRERERWVTAEDFFVASYVTAAREDEMLTEARIPARPAGEGWAFLEVSPREGDFALAGVAALTRAAGEILRGPKVVWVGAAFRPLRASPLEARLEGTRTAGEDLERMVAEAVSVLQPPSDHRASGEYRRAALRELTVRALRLAAARAGGGEGGRS